MGVLGEILSAQSSINQPVDDIGIHHVLHLKWASYIIGRPYIKLFLLIESIGCIVNKWHTPIARPRLLSLLSLCRLHVLYDEH